MVTLWGGSGSPRISIGETEDIRARGKGGLPARGPGPLCAGELLSSQLSDPLERLGRRFMTLRIIQRYPKSRQFLLLLPCCCPCCLPPRCASSSGLVLGRRGCTIGIINLFYVITILYHFPPPAYCLLPGGEGKVADTVSSPSSAVVPPLPCTG